MRRISEEFGSKTNKSDFKKIFMKQQKLKLALFALGLALATARVEANRPPKRKW